jgi:cyclase
MLAKRIIPCLDIKDGQTVKGINFVNIKSVGDPVELGALYAEQGADELVFLDITASHEGRKTFVELVKRIAREINIPFTVGGGISEITDAEKLLSAGADKVSINSSAVRNPKLIDDLALNFGNQFVVVAIDARGNEAGHWTVTVNGGRIPTDKELFSWAKEAEDRGAGEILFTSMNHDGTKNGFANKELAQLSENLSIPIIASGGAGTMDHFVDVFTKGKADAGLAASIFHYKEIGIPELKHYLQAKGIPVRL